MYILKQKINGVWNTVYVTSPECPSTLPVVLDTDSEFSRKWWRSEYAHKNNVDPNDLHFFKIQQGDVVSPYVVRVYVAAPVIPKQFVYGCKP